jgi:putative Ca2+/H+ antiporter (TMEM165/GDT1 family)
MLSVFLVSTAAVVLAEMGDKTQLLAMAFATRFRWQTVLWAVLAATLANHFLAAVAGNLITAVLPIHWVKLAASVAFILFALWTVKGDHLEDEDKRQGRSPFWTVAVAFFLAEMGDKTQLMTIALAAEQSVKAAGTGALHQLVHLLPVWMGTTCGMMVADAFGILVGIVLHKRIPERLVKWTAACGFAIFGLLDMHDSLDGIVPGAFTLHHMVLLASIPVIAALMWAVSRLSAPKT